MPAPIRDVQTYNAGIQNGEPPTDLLPGVVANLTTNADFGTKLDIYPPDDHPIVLGGGFIIGSGVAPGTGLGEPTGQIIRNNPIDMTGLPVNSGRTARGWEVASSDPTEQFLSVWVIAAST